MDNDLNFGNEFRPFNANWLRRHLMKRKKYHEIGNGFEDNALNNSFDDSNDENN